MSVGEIRVSGEERLRLLCDGGHFAPPDCVIYEGLPPGIEGEAPVPDGWLAVTDPFGRRSRRTGATLTLHLCPACVRHIPEDAPIRTVLVGGAK